MCPGFIDAHLHMESTLATPFGAGAACDQKRHHHHDRRPPEIVNVCGAAAVRYLLDATEQLPVNVYLMLPSSVPATAFETNGADFHRPGHMAPLLTIPGCWAQSSATPDVVAAGDTSWKN